MTMTYRVIRAMFGLESGRACRSCGEAIHAHDAFGISEGVCRPCRQIAA
ncbi:MAG TPA: hypothetical protein VLV28_03570 [Gaiellaceae bacterium]|nr:hypothetical protein [Gaiellaceae bacterium]